MNVVADRTGTGFKEMMGERYALPHASFAILGNLNSDEPQFLHL